MDSLDWTAEHIQDLIQEQLHKGNITQDDVLATLGDRRPVKVIARGDVSDMVKTALEQRGLTIALLSDITDQVIGELEGNVGPDEISWDYVDKIIEEVCSTHYGESL